MILKSMKYSEYPHNQEEWHLEEFSLEKINLIVGKNAAGKTRTLNIIGGLAKLLSSDSKLIFDTGNYDVQFDKNDKENSKIIYILNYKEYKVIKEELIINGEPKLNRTEGGEGEIFYNTTKQKMKFQTPDNQLASVARRDSIQHPFFEDLYQWGNLTRHYLFGEKLGKSDVLIKNKSEGKINLPEISKNPNKVVEIFKYAKKNYKNKFINSIKKDMKLIGYKIDDIGYETISGVTFQPNIPEVEGLYIKETDLTHKVYQFVVSDGMFRALSLIIQLNFLQFEKVQSCIIIDDIGEGLDYERSTALIKLLIEKVENSSLIQLIMSTNDRFVMNSVPLKYWNVIQRNGNKCKILNYRNSKKIFDEFKYTGLANFDFLSTEFYKNGFDQQ